MILSTKMQITQQAHSGNAGEFGIRGRVAEARAARGGVCEFYIFSLNTEHRYKIVTTGTTNTKNSVKVRLDSPLESLAAGRRGSPIASKKRP